MKHLLILISFLSWFFSLFAQQDTSITVRSYKTGEGKVYTTRDTIIRGYKLKTLTIKRDSLNFANSRFQKAFYDTGKAYKMYTSYDFVNNDTLSKEITTEVACNPDATIFIENLYRKLVVKTSPDNKVKITTTINYSADDKFTDEEWFQELNLQLKSNNNQVVLKSDNIRADNGLRTTTFITGQSTSSSAMKVSVDTLKRPDNPPNPPKALTITGQGSSPALQNGASVKGLYGKPVQLYDFRPIFDGDGNWVNKRSNTQKLVTIYIPTGAKLDVESKYADVEIQNDIKSLKADITNASLRFTNVETADIQSKYGRINAGNIKKADIELNNGKFYAKDIYSGKFDSKYSNIEFGKSNDLKIESNNDQYEIDEVSDLVAHKNYGNVRITNLKNKFNLTGNNADIKIRDIAAGVTEIKIDDKYADIRLPLNNVANYSVDFDGKNCNVYAPFDKIPVLKIEEVKPKEQPKQVEEIKVSGFKSLSTLTRVNIVGDAKDNGFKGSVGDIKGKHAELQLKCTNCTVDFK